MLHRYTTIDFTVMLAPSYSRTHWHTRKEEREKKEEQKCSSKNAVVSRRVRNLKRSCLFFLITLVLLRKKRAHKYRAEATSDRLVKATRAVHASHPCEPVTTDSALISLGRAIHGKRSITRRFISVVLFLPFLPRFLILLFLLFCCIPSWYISNYGMIVGSRRDCS